MNQIDALIRRDFTIINAYDGTASIKPMLLKARALVVHDEFNRPIGILTVTDLLYRPYYLVIDCLAPKERVSSELNLIEAINVFQTTDEEVLPVYSGDRLVGLIYRDDIINQAYQQINILENQVAEFGEALKKIAWLQSHKVRQPVASILGLIQLIDSSALHDENKEIFNLLRKSTADLDEIIATIVNRASSNQYFAYAPSGTTLFKNQIDF